MLWLAIDGALGAFSAALVASDDTRGPRVARASGNDALERGLTILDEVLGDTPLARIDALAVGTGPGSFTGLRIALAYAKSLAFAAQVPLAGISSYDALSPRDAPLPHATFVHGRAGIACVRLRLAGGTERRETSVGGTRHAGYEERTVCGTYEQIARSIAADLPPGTEIVAYGNAEGAVAALGERGIIVRVAPTEIVHPALAIARRAIADGLPGNPHALRADYGEAHYAERQAAPAQGAPARGAPGTARP